MRRAIIFSIALLLLVSSAPAQTSYQGYADPMDLVEHWYQTFLYRSARTDPNSRLWARELREGAAPNAVLSGILGSDEYYTKGGRTPEGFIRNLFADIVVRQPTPSELQYWMQRTLAGDINDPKTRQDIAYDILTQNPGSAAGSYVTPPPVVTPPPPVYRDDREREREHERERERERERARAREREHYDYRRPDYPFRH